MQGLLVVVVASILVGLVGCSKEEVQDDDTPGDDDSGVGDDDSGSDDDDASDHCTGDYIIESENDLNAIIQCESINGDLRFDDQDWLTSIDLPNLESVGGDLWIENNDALTSLNMPFLSTAGGDLGIYGNDALASLDMPCLTSVGGYLGIYSNDALPSIDGLSSLESVDGDLGFEGQPGLTSLGG